MTIEFTSFVYNKKAIMDLTELMVLNSFQASTVLEIVISDNVSKRAFIDGDKPESDTDLAIFILRLLEKINRTADGEENVWHHPEVESWVKEALD